jgi:hypothetical protein
VFVSALNVIRVDSGHLHDVSSWSSGQRTILSQTARVELLLGRRICHHSSNFCNRSNVNEVDWLPHDSTSPYRYERAHVRGTLAETGNVNTHTRNAHTSVDAASFSFLSSPFALPNSVKHVLVLCVARVTSPVDDLRREDARRLQEQIDDNMMQMRSVGFHPFDMFDVARIVVALLDIVHDASHRLSDVFGPFVGRLLHVVGDAVHVKTAATRAQRPTSDRPAGLGRRDETEIAPIGHSHGTRLDARTTDVAVRTRLVRFTC